MASFMLPMLVLFLFACSIKPARDGCANIEKRKAQGERIRPTAFFALLRQGFDRKILMTTLLRTTLIAAALALPVVVQAKQSVPPKPAALPQKTTRAQGLWIDVRTPQEFRSGHLQGAINIPVQQIRAGIAAASPDKNAPLNLYCRSGRRVEAAMQELKAMGYTNITNHGGYENLLRQGLR